MRKTRIRLLLLAFVMLVPLGGAPAQAVNRTCALTGSSAGGSCTFVSSGDGILHLTYMTNWNQADFYLSGPPFGSYPIISGPVYNEEIAGVPNTTYTLVALPNSSGNVVASAYRPHPHTNGYTDPTGNADVGIGRPASAPTVAVGTNGCASALIAASGTGCATGTAAMSGTGTANGTAAASGTQCATGAVAVSVTNCANGSLLAVSGIGTATGSGGTATAAVSGTGTATTNSTAGYGVAASGTNTANAQDHHASGSESGYAVSGIGCAYGNRWAVATSCAESPWNEAKAIGDASSKNTAVTVVGNATAYDPDPTDHDSTAVAGTGEANAAQIAISGLSDANASNQSPDAGYAISGADDANGSGVAVSGLGQSSDATLVSASGEDESVYVQHQEFARTHARRDAENYALNYPEFLVDHLESEADSLVAENDPTNLINVSVVAGEVASQVEELTGLRATLAADPLTGRADIGLWLDEQEIIYKEINLFDLDPLDPPPAEFNYAPWEFEFKYSLELVWDPTRPQQPCHCHTGKYVVPLWKAIANNVANGYWLTGMKASVKGLGQWFGTKVRPTLWPTMKASLYDAIDWEPWHTIYRQSPPQNAPSYNFEGCVSPFKYSELCGSVDWNPTYTEKIGGGQEASGLTEVYWKNDSPGMCPGDYMGARGIQTWRTVNNLVFRFSARGYSNWQERPLDDVNDYCG